MFAHARAAPAHMRDEHGSVEAEASPVT